jgi:lipopolysaccharide heptosyltransferase II
MKILLIQLRRIGDVVVTTPVIDALRAARPDARIEFIVEEAPAPVLEGYPGLDEVIVFRKADFFRTLAETRRRRYDWVLDFMNNPRTAQITLASGAKVRAGFDVPGWGLVYNVRIPRPRAPKYAVQSKFDLLRALGLTPPERALPRLRVTADDFSGVAAWWRSSGLDGFAERVAVAPTHRHAVRRWPAPRFRELMERLLATSGRALVVFGGPGEEDYVRSVCEGFGERVFVTPRTTLRQAAALLSRCHAVATSDGGLMHLAVAVGTPTITVYGPTWPESWNPRVSPHRWVQAEGLNCVGCNRDACPYGHECLEWVSAGRVHGVVEEVLAARAGTAPARA